MRACDPVLIRPTLCEDALRLGRILAALTPQEPEVHGLGALMEIQASRTRARVPSTGEPVLLFDQNRTQWDQLLIHRGLAAIERAHKINSTRGPYLMQAEIAACHARARTPSETDWPRIVGLYTELAQLTPSPVIELNRAVAVAMSAGPEAGLPLVEEVERSGALAGYHLLPAAKADLLRRLGRPAEAAGSYREALALAGNASERRFLGRRLDEAEAAASSAPLAAP